MRRIAIVNEKGGVSKTTTAINLAVAFVRRGKRVLLVDTDPQSNATLVMLGGRAAESPTLADVLLGEAAAVEAIRPAVTDGVDVLPASPELADVALELASMIGRERRLAEALAEVEDSYDIVLIDTSPQRSLLSVNALAYAWEVLVPVEPGLFSLAGLGQLQSAIADVRRFLGNRELELSGLILSRTRRDAVSRDVEARLRADFGPLVFNATVPQSVKVEEAHSRYLSVLDHAPRSPGAVAFEALADEVLSREQHTPQKRTRGASRRSDASHDPAA